MSSIQAVTIFGRLGSDPELRYTPKQKPVCTFSIAENVPGTDQPVWHRIVVWGKPGEDCKLHLRKGLPVFVQGQNSEREFVHNGETKKQTETTADYVGIPLPKESKNA